MTNLAAHRFIVVVQKVPLQQEGDQEEEAEEDVVEAEVVNEVVEKEESNAAQSRLTISMLRWRIIKRRCPVPLKTRKDERSL